MVAIPATLTTPPGVYEAAADTLPEPTLIRGDEVRCSGRACIVQQVGWNGQPSPYYNDDVPEVNWAGQLTDEQEDAWLEYMNSSAPLLTEDDLWNMEYPTVDRDDLDDGEDYTTGSLRHINVR